MVRLGFGLRYGYGYGYDSQSEAGVRYLPVIVYGYNTRWQ